MVVDLFLRTYNKDAKWLPFLFRSLIRHVRGFRHLIVVTPSNSTDAVLKVVDPYAMRLVSSGVVAKIQAEECSQWKDDYNGQQLSKLTACAYSSADEVLYLDSDLVFIKDVVPSTRSGIIEARPWDQAGDGVCWKGVTDHLLRRETVYETMCRHPFQHSVQQVRRCFEHVGGVDRLMNISQSGVMYKDRPMVHFSEFNIMGNYAHLIEGRPVTLVGDPTWQPDVVRQFWSVGGITPDVEIELKHLGYWEDTP